MTEVLLTDNFMNEENKLRHTRTETFRQEGVF